MSKGIEKGQSEAEDLNQKERAYLKDGRLFLFTQFSSILCSMRKLYILAFALSVANLLLAASISIIAMIDFNHNAQIANNPPISTTENKPVFVPKVPAEDRYY